MNHTPYQANRSSPAQSLFTSGTQLEGI